MKLQHGLLEVHHDSRLTEKVAKRKFVQLHIAALNRFFHFAKAHVVRTLLESHLNLQTLLLLPVLDLAWLKSSFSSSGKATTPKLFGTIFSTQWKSFFVENAINRIAQGERLEQIEVDHFLAVLRCVRVVLLLGALERSLDKELHGQKVVQWLVQGQAKEAFRLFREKGLKSFLQDAVGSTLGGGSFSDRESISDCGFYAWCNVEKIRGEVSTWLANYIVQIGNHQFHTEIRELLSPLALVAAGALGKLRIIPDAASCDQIDSLKKTTNPETGMVWDYKNKEFKKVDLLLLASLEEPDNLLSATKIEEGNFHAGGYDAASGSTKRALTDLHRLNDLEQLEFLRQSVVSLRTLLRPVELRVLELRYQNGSLSNREVARRLGVDEKTIRNARAAIVARAKELSLNVF